MEAKEFARAVQLWLKSRLEDGGFEQVSVTEIRPMPQHAADWLAAGDLRRLLTNAENENVAYFEAKTDMGTFGCIFSESSFSDADMGAFCDFKNLGIRSQVKFLVGEEIPDAAADALADSSFCPFNLDDDTFFSRLGIIMARQRPNGPKG